MTTVFARHALTPDGWVTNATISMAEGRITAVAPDSPGAADAAHDLVIPGMPNLHSHAFQRAMAGRAEHRGSTTDTFWTWREVMYQFALAMTPDEMEAVAAMAYVEMLEGGFTRVGEFHYLHNDHDGGQYANPAEMAERIAAASMATGIRLTLLPVFYAHADFGGEPPTPGQRRFISDVEGFKRLLAASAEAIAGLPGAVLGIAPHSLRAVTPDELDAVVALDPDGPIHIHVAEQTREVEASVAWSGQRPVDWLLMHAEVDRRWTLIHATHMDPSETRRMAQSGAVAGLCPVTEGNLGDGIFPGPAFVRDEGTYGIGTDSNVRISVHDELRQLEYAQRLAAQQRNVLARDGGSTALSMLEAGLVGGSQSLGAEPGGLVVGAPADLISLRSTLWEGDDPDAMLDAWVFARGVNLESTWVHGGQVVQRGVHRDREAIVNRYRAAMRGLIARA